MKNTKIWLPIFLGLASLVASTNSYADTKATASMNKALDTYTPSCDWWPICEIQKVLPSGSYNLLGPGVGGDPSSSKSQPVKQKTVNKKQ